MVVPGSQAVKHQAEAEGLDRIFKSAGFEWREPGCCMCLGMNPDILPPGERCASTTNRNFEGRQGRGGRTHLLSPAMAAAAAITGHFTDVRTWKFKPNAVQLELTTETENPMRPINILTSTAAPLPLPNIDTDQIIPKQFLKRIERTGYGDFLFYDWRYDLRHAPTTSPSAPTSSSTSPSTRAPRSSSPSATSAAAPPASTPPGPSTSTASAPSSPPPSPTSSSPTPARTASSSPPSPKPKSKPSSSARTANPAHKITINLEAQTVTDDEGFHAHFDIDPFRKHCLLNGLDDIGLTLLHEDKLNAYESQHQQEFWLSPKSLTTK